MFVSVYLNVGLFNEFGEYDQIFEEMVEIIEGFVWDGFLNIIGGCCGFWFDYIEVIVNVVVKYLFWKILEWKKLLCLFGLELFIGDENILFINVGECINVIGFK